MSGEHYHRPYLTRQYPVTMADAEVIALLSEVLREHVRQMGWEPIDEHVDYRITRSRSALLVTVQIIARHDHADVPNAPVHPEPAPAAEGALSPEFDIVAEAEALLATRPDV